MLSNERLRAYREQTFRSAQRLRVTSAKQAVEFVNQRGFVFFWPIKGVLMPSLWAAAAGDRPVPDERDDAGHITWDWKDQLLPKKVWYYARLLRKRNTIVALDTIPYFYALSPNYGSPEEDYLIEYEEGRMPMETRLVYEALLNEGPLDTIALRKAARLTGENSSTGFNRALEQLQVDLRILPVGISDAGAWHYAFIYDLVHRHFPDLIDQAREISEHEARRHLIARYLLSVGAVPTREVERVFNLWRSEDVRAAVEKLLAAGRLVKIEIEGEKDEWLAAPELSS